MHRLPLLLLSAMLIFPCYSGENMLQNHQLNIFDTIKNNNKHAFIELLKTNTNVLESRNESNQTPLMYAIYQGNEPFAKRLIRRC